MNDAAQARAPRVHGSPDGKVVGAIEPESVAGVIRALDEADFPTDRIDVVTMADLDSIDSPLEHDGLKGFVERFLLSVGEELTAIEDLRQVARQGHTLIGVPVDSEESMHRAANILHDQGAHAVTHFGRWTITTL